MLRQPLKLLDELHVLPSRHTLIEHVHIGSTGEVAALQQSYPNISVKRSGGARAYLSGSIE